ncbi:HTH_Tnp_Tc3_2 domain-containing protein [Trichonephila clavipes]|nr:HTH_Tnp_Tc3_2 domain-containing protein [Trichonephila clavipes]
MKTAGSSTHRVTGRVWSNSVCDIAKIVENPVDTRRIAHARKTGSGSTRKTTRREHRRIVRHALVDPTVIRSTIRADVRRSNCSTNNFSIYLAEANLKALYPLLPLGTSVTASTVVPSESMWNVTDW